MDQGDLAAAADEPETAVPAVQETFLWLDRSLRAALLTQFPKLSAEAQKIVREKLDRRAYGEAALEIAHQIREAEAKAQGMPSPRRTALTRGAPGAAMPGAAADPVTGGGSLWGRITGLRFERAEWEPLRLPVDLSPEGLAQTRARIVQEIWKVTGLRTGLAWVGLLWMAFLLFHDKAGTFTDLVEAFIWGFSTDVTVDAFWNVAKAYKKA